ncbi:MAG TPA: hypothetical protein VIF15_12740 [Polyangiaceae bacterium]
MLSRVWSLSALVAALAACSGSSAADAPSTAPDAATAGDASNASDASAPASDAADAGSPPWTSPAAHPVMPHVVDFGGSVLAHPRVQPLVFAGDPFAADIAAFTAGIGKASYWAAIGQEYGVGAIAGLPLATAAEAAPAAVTDAQVQTWINQKIAGGLVPAPDGETIYTVFYPAGTTVTSAAGTSCTSFYGYHGEGKTAAGAPFVYAVLPRCHDAYHADLDNVTNSTSHELIEASTNPYFATAPAYARVDTDHYVWAISSGGSTEVGDMCALVPGAGYLTPPDLPYAVQRMWSNAAAAASHDPCVPAPAGPYFNAAPVLPDTVTIDFGAQGKLTTQAVRIPVGQSRTIDVDLYSDGPTGPWKVEALDLATLEKKPAALGLQLDRATGANGDVLHLTITPLQTESYGIEAFYLGSGLAGRSTLWVGLVSN